MANSDKYSSLLRCEIHYGGKKVQELNEIKKVISEKFAKFLVHAKVGKLQGVLVHSPGKEGEIQVLAGLAGTS
jgi:hypothetical protein